jgi:hypothetical protein
VFPLYQSYQRYSTDANATPALCRSFLSASTTRSCYFNLMASLNVLLKGLVVYIPATNEYVRDSIKSSCDSPVTSSFRWTVRLLIAPSQTRSFHLFYTPLLTTAATCLIHSLQKSFAPIFSVTSSHFMCSSSSQNSSRSPFTFKNCSTAQDLPDAFPDGLFPVSALLHRV